MNAFVNVIVNGQPRELPADATVATLLEELRLTGRPVAVEVNFELAPRRDHARAALREGDRVEIAVLQGGG